MNKFTNIKIDSTTCICGFQDTQFVMHICIQSLFALVTEHAKYRMDSIYADNNIK